MKGEAQNFKWFKDRIFEIPFFQRPYVWKEDNWEELWNNIVLNSAEEMPFIGSFILQIKDDRGLVNYIVIDGQQRLTTLSILIKAFLDSSSDLKNDDEYSGAMNEIESYIITIASVITALGVIFGVIFAVYRWYLKQEKQDKDIKAIKEEQTILTYGVLACLKGLKEQGCDGPVTSAINQIEKYINKQAHK